MHRECASTKSPAGGPPPRQLHPCVAFISEKMWQGSPRQDKRGSAPRLRWRMESPIHKPRPPVTQWPPATFKNWRMAPTKERAGGPPPRKLHPCVAFISEKCGKELLGKISEDLLPAYGGIWRNRQYCPCCPVAQNGTQRGFGCVTLQEFVQL